MTHTRKHLVKYMNTDAKDVTIYTNGGDFYSVNVQEIAEDGRLIDEQWKSFRGSDSHDKAIAFAEAQVACNDDDDTRPYKECE